MSTQSEQSRSTGPRSESGKQTSSKNSLTHGLTATSIERFSPAIQAQFSVHREKLLAEYLPATEDERIYFERYAFAQFLVLQSQNIEAVLFEEALNDPKNELALNKLKTIARYTRTLERSADRARAVLNELQANRHAAFVLQDIVTHAHNSDVQVPAAAPIKHMLEPKNYKMNLETLSIAIIHCEKQRQFEAVEPT